MVKKRVATQSSAYDLHHKKETLRRHVFAVIVDNEPGVLARVIGLFSGRGYNIESLTVSPINEDNTISRITIVTTGTLMVIRQICTQLDRLISTYEVYDLTLDGNWVESDLALIKFYPYDNKSSCREEAFRIAQIFNSTVVDTTLSSMVFRLTAKPSRIDDFLKLLRELGTIEIARSGVVAMHRGESVINIDSVINIETKE